MKKQFTQNDVAKAVKFGSKVLGSFFVAIGVIWLLTIDWRIGIAVFLVVWGKNIDQRD